MDIALILSTAVSAVAIISALITSVYQAYCQKKTQAMGMYFEAQLKAYTDFFVAAADLERDLKENEKRDIRELIKFAKIAETVSPDIVAKCINDFCAVYADYLVETDISSDNQATEELAKEFKESLFIATTFMRAELMRYDNKKREYEKKFLKM